MPDESSTQPVPVQNPEYALRTQLDLSAHGNCGMLRAMTHRKAISDGNPQDPAELPENIFEHACGLCDFSQRLKLRGLRVLDHSLELRSLRRFLQTKRSRIPAIQ